MATVDPTTGNVTFTSEEFAQMQASKQASNKSGGEDDKKSLADRWRDKFAPKAPAKQQRQEPTLQEQPLTREALYEAAKKLNFLEPTAEQMEKMRSGDVETFMQVQQDGLRRVFADSAMASNGLVDHRQGTSRQEMQAMMQDMLRRHDGAREIQSQTGDFLNVPGGDVLVSALTQKFSQEGKAPGEVGQLVSSYLKDFSSNFGQQANQPSAREVATQEAQQSATDF